MVTAASLEICVAAPAAGEPESSEDADADADADADSDAGAGPEADAGVCDDAGSPCASTDTGDIATALTPTTTTPPSIARHAA
ncbi:hypothetical protein [Roseateles amylovorans]|uniref:Uncharacterized protein n=1 Tax=Roseateles amylovorans TaxID=2978473 RepID=A0ABY6B1M6_9BURK|nr:hypothetical protein [Roseateles amylovorans]UXH77418.1 hypothetical protein N4261_20805 [Roseateles amylovorans]